MRQMLDYPVRGEDAICGFRNLKGHENKEGVDAMSTSWKTEADGILCRWSETGEGVRTDAALLQEASAGVDRSVTPGIPDFAAHSPMGSREWFVPWNARWGVPTKSAV